MKIKWNIVDQILDITGSTPKQLLDWMSDSDVMDFSFPCSAGELYLGMYSFVEADIYDYEEVSLGDMGIDDEIEVFVTEIAEDVDIYHFWEMWRSDLDGGKFRANMRRNFKRRYEL